MFKVEILFVQERKKLVCLYLITVIMSRKSSLASQNSMKLDQEMRECRMAYLSVLSSTNESMTSSKELTLGLYRC